MREVHAHDACARVLCTGHLRLAPLRDKARRACARRAANVMQDQAQGTWIRTTSCRTPKTTRPRSAWPTGVSWEFPEGCCDQPSELIGGLIRQIVTVPQVRQLWPHAGRTKHLRPRERCAIKHVGKGRTHKGCAVYAANLRCQAPHAGRIATATICYQHTRTSTKDDETAAASNHLRLPRSARDGAVTRVPLHCEPDLAPGTCLDARAGCFSHLDLPYPGG